MQDWKDLPFGYFKTDYNIRCYYRDGKWGQLEISSSEQIVLHIAATSLHYGQEAFEGLKAFRGKDGKVRIFRVEENAKRMQESAKGILLAEVPDEIFIEAVKQVVILNEKYIPPFESGASLYIRPLLIGSGPQVGVKPATEYLFMVFATPVGPYFKEGFKPTDVLLSRVYDRAAPQGTGNIKVGGNYAASLRIGEQAKNQGYSMVLYLDPKEKKYIDECGPANFFAIKQNAYITPKSESILPSITNKSLMAIAEDLGMDIEQRLVSVDELGDFDEVGACGTAAVISPVRRIFDYINDKDYVYCQNDQAGPVCLKLYNHLRAIQYGELPDKFGWCTILDI